MTYVSELDEKSKRAAGTLPRARFTAWSATLADYWTLTKPEVNFLIVMTTLAGFYLGSPTGRLRLLLLVHTLLGTLLVASGTATLNQYVERCYDARMRRTARRPLPAGRLAPARALWFGILLSMAGGFCLALAVNWLACALAAFTLLSYLLLYTPLKRKTPFCTLIGAFPGAVPPLIGWAGARGSLSAEAWVLYAILFLWQFPHFLSIAWMYREDYNRAGYQMLPSSDRKGSSMAWQVVLFSLALLLVSLIPTFLGFEGIVYFLGTLVLGLGFLFYGARLALERSNSLARRLVFGSVVYLPLVWTLMILDKS
jgi:protoheme IX farnesyltransferase